MGACYSCNGCGKCTEWIKDYDGVCPICKAKYNQGDKICSNCGRPLPLSPGETK